MKDNGILWFSMAFLLAAVQAGCSVNPVTGKRELIFIPESQEIAMGVQAAPQFEKEFGGTVPNDRLQGYIQELGKKIAAVSDRQMPWDFALVGSKTPNAFALPGGKVFVTAGLFGSLANERQLAAVLGHEIGHVCAKHNVKGLQRQMTAEVFASVAGKLAGDKAEAAEAAAKIAGNMAVMKYSRDDEYQADALGVKYMEKAGFNPWGMVETLEFLLKLGGSEPSKFEEMFQTHPLTSARVKQAKDKVSAEYPAYKPTQGDARAEIFAEMRRLLP